MENETKGIFTVGDYELLTVLMEEAMLNRDEERVIKIKSLKRKIYDGLVAKGHKESVIEILNHLSKNSGFEIINGYRKVNVEKKA